MRAVRGERAVNGGRKLWERGGGMCWNVSVVHIRHARYLFCDVGVGESGTNWKVEYMAARKYSQGPRLRITHFPGYTISSRIPHALAMDYPMG